jgi:hypothetical protein
MAHERAREEHDRIVVWHEDQYNAFWFLANVWPAGGVDRELDALWLGPFLEVVKDVLDLFKRGEVLDAKSQMRTAHGLG